MFELQRHSNYRKSDNSNIAKFFDMNIRIRERKLPSLRVFHFPRKIVRPFIAMWAKKSFNLAHKIFIFLKNATFWNTLHFGIEKMWLITTITSKMSISPLEIELGRGNCWRDVKSCLNYRKTRITEVRIVASIMWVC